MSAVASYLAVPRLLYSTLWEDHDVLCRGLDPRPEDNVLSVASAGCNVLALAAMGPRSVTAVDLNPAQLHLLELKLRAAAQLDHVELAELTGARASDRREQLYERVRPHLSAAAAAHWDAAHDLLLEGVERTGRLERYFADFAHGELLQTWGPDRVQALLNAPSVAAQRAVFDDTAALQELRQAFGRHFGAERMAAQGRSEEQLAHVDRGNLGEVIFQRFVRLCATRRVAGNPYLERFLTGAVECSEQAAPYYTEAGLGRLRPFLNRVRLVHGDVLQQLDDEPLHHYAAANLSDLFEYFPEADSDRAFERLADRMRPGARVAYWNLLVERRPPARLQHRMHLLPRSADLHAQDRVFFYQDFRVEEVLP